jgi:hypothetical protein
MGRTSISQANSTVALETIMIFTRATWILEYSMASNKHQCALTYSMRVCSGTQQIIPPWALFFNLSAILKLNIKQ